MTAVLVSLLLAATIGLGVYLTTQIGFALAMVICGVFVVGCAGSYLFAFSRGVHDGYEIAREYYARKGCR